jgi:hypothetical protein
VRRAGRDGDPFVEHVAVRWIRTPSVQRDGVQHRRSCRVDRRDGEPERGGVSEWLGPCRLALRGDRRRSHRCPHPIADDQLAQYLESVSQSGATNLSTAEPVNIDGVSGVMITYNLTPSPGVTAKDEDMVVNQGGDTYDIVLNTAAANFSADQAALQTVLNSWKWA